jgi:hypothetical protein
LTTPPPPPPQKQKQKIEKYLAAAGKNQFEADTA